MSEKMNEKFKVMFIYPNIMMATLVPIHVSLLSACLKEKGFEVDLFDATYYKTDDVNFEKKKVDLLQLKPFNFNDKGVVLKQTDIYEDLSKKIKEYRPDLIGITMVEDTYNLSRSLLESIKDFKIPVIAGGVFVTFSPDEVISNETVDMVCVGEGEEALVELCEKMSNGQDYSKVRNLWIKKQDKIIKNPLRPLTDVNKLPPIDYDIYEEGRLYRPMFGKVFTMIHVELDRGCPYDCTYCESPSLRKLFHENGCGIYYRKKSANTIMREMKHLVEKYRPDYVNFNSETFLAKTVNELKEFAEMYKDIGIPFWCQTRPETVTEEKIKILKGMNCNSLQFGIEHGNETFRVSILGRHSSNEKIVKCLKIVEEYEIPYTVNNIIGFPDETRELVFDTIKLNSRINPRTMNCYLFTPYKGTVLHEKCLKKGYLEKDYKVHQLLDGVPLEMDTISYEELQGLQRTFSLYARFPESEWGNIKIAEKFDEEGNKMFEQLSEKYREEYFA
ncbi:MAG: radical SAM protein [Candidatus Omnitrophota bacterium]